MESPVTGGITPLSLGELRQAILAVYIGNPLFSPAEQLEANHDAHECEDLPYMVAWLKGVRLEDAKRGFLRRNQVAQALDYPGVCLGKDAHLLEMEALLGCRALLHYQKQSAWGVAYPGPARFSCPRRQLSHESQSLPLRRPHLGAGRSPAPVHRRKVTAIIYANNCKSSNCVCVCI